MSVFHETEINVSGCIVFMSGCVLCMEGNSDGQKPCQWKNIPGETVGFAFKVYQFIFAMM